MSINGMRSPASAALPSSPAAPGNTGANTKKMPDPGLNDAHQAVLSDRPPQQGSEAAAPPRIAVAKLPSVRQEPAVDTLPEATQAIAAKVCSEVENGKVALLASHSAACLSAAAAAASRGLVALERDLPPRR